MSTTNSKPDSPTHVADSNIAPKSGGDVVAYVAPFIVYVLLTSVESKGWLGLGYEAWYSLKAVAVAGTLLWYRRAYPSFSTRGLPLGVAAGVVGIVVWLVLARVQELIPGLNDWIASFLGSRSEYNPFGEEGATAAQIGFVAVRLIGLAVIVPVMEEMLWRGFLARYLINSDDFSAVPQGTFTASSFAIVTAAFVAVHPELLAATAWGILINLLYRRTQNVWACVAMHAVTNALLGGWILATGAWKLW